MTSPFDAFHRLRASATRGIWVEGCAVLLLAFVGFALVSFAADRLLSLEVGYRLALLIALAALLGWQAYVRLLLPLRVDLSDEELALAVERSDPQVRQALISAVQFDQEMERGERRSGSAALMRAVVDDVERRGGELPLDRSLDRRRVRRFAALLLGCLGALTLCSALDPATARLWAARNLALSAAEWPRATHLAFRDTGGAGLLRVAEGADFTLVVQASGVVPEQVFLHYAFAGGDTGVEPMTLTADDQFTITLKSLLEDVEVHAEGGDGRTAPLRLQMVARPRIDSLEVTVVYPAYMRRPASRVSSTEGDVLVPRGSQVEIRATASKQLRSAMLAFGQEERHRLELDAARRTAHGSFAPADSGVLALHVVDVDQLDAAQPPRLFLRLVEDRAPRVDFRPRGIGMMITPHAVVPGDLSVEDDYGLSAVAGWFRVTGLPDQGSAAPSAAGAGVESSASGADEAPWRPAEVAGLASLAGDTAAFSTATAFDLRPLAPDEDAMSERNAARPGQMLSLRFTATDNFAPGSAHVGESDAAVFRVVTRERLLDDLARRQAEQRHEVEQILVEEKADVAELRDIIAPGDEGRASQARTRVASIAGKQRALGKRLHNAHDQVAQVLDELLNNRLLEPSQVAQLRLSIARPLHALATEEFPASAEAVAAFAVAGHNDLRQVAVLSYEAIIASLERVLGHMDEMESFSALLEALRRVINLQEAAIREAARQRAEHASSLFDPLPHGPGQATPRQEAPDGGR